MLQRKGACTRPEGQVACPRDGKSDGDPSGKNDQSSDGSTTWVALRSGSVKTWRFNSRVTT